MNDEYYMELALEEAQLALDEGNWPIGSVIVLDNKVISKGHNKVYSLKDRTAHAEMNTIKNVAERLFNKDKRATIYATYEPCPMCFGAIILNTFERVVCGIDLDESGALHIRDNMPPAFKHEQYKFDITRGVLAEECYDIFIKSEQAQSLIKKGRIKELRGELGFTYV